tara:strand:- start:86 stop:652 length:567 start_codon:yes stop_codon:yes gene_type:complete
LYIKFGKRLFDLLLFLLISILILPFLPFLLIALKSFDTGPLIFRQDRVGKDGKMFKLLKFRSMPEYISDMPSDKIDHIPLNPMQRFIRRTNIDEIPQLINIFNAEMSFIGPRPALFDQQELIELRRLGGSFELRPGLTGLAQINSFDGMSVNQKAELDNLYSLDIRFYKDIIIFFRTFIYLLKPPPVY